jgi:hypothetical protein
MMKISRYMLVLAVALLLTSALVYLVAYDLFGRADEIEFWLLMETAFVPIQVLLVGLVLDRLLALQARHQRLRKMNMVIGTFFSELGTRLLGDLVAALENRAEVTPVLGIRGDWSAAHYQRALDQARHLEYRVNPDALDLPVLRQTLTAQRGMLVMLLANPNLMEHERFTDLLWAVFHLMEELQARPSFADLPKSDRDHLAGDANRVLSHLAVEWLHYCHHLHQSYPYIHSILVRTQPLQDAPSAIVK